ncbi:MAG: hypothetical protein AAGC95_10160 [Pseudomonadota bacterium]
MALTRRNNFLVGTSYSNKTDFYGGRQIALSAKLTCHSATMLAIDNHSHFFAEGHSIDRLRRHKQKTAISPDQLLGGIFAVCGRQSLHVTPLLRRVLATSWSAVKPIRACDLKEGLFLSTRYTPAAASTTNRSSFTMYTNKVFMT